MKSGSVLSLVLACALVSGCKAGAACDVALGPPCLTPAPCIVGGNGTAGVCTLPSSPSCG